MPVYGFRFYFTPLTGVLFTFPSRYSFTIGSCLVFSLGSWSTQIPTRFLVPRRTQVPHQEVQIISRTWISHSLSGLPRPFRYNLVFCQLLGSSPCGPTTPLLWFGLLRFRSPLLTESLLISVPGLLRWFTSPSLTPVSYFIQIFRCMYFYIRVTPFGHLRVNGYVLLTVAFRSLSRPSSPYSSIGIHHKPIFRLTILSLSSSSPCYPSLHLLSFRQA